MKMVTAATATTSPIGIHDSSACWCVPAVTSAPPSVFGAGDDAAGGEGGGGEDEDGDGGGDGGDEKLSLKRTVESLAGPLDQRTLNEVEQIHSTR